MFEYTLYYTVATDLKDVIPLRVQNHHALIEMMVLHRAGRVQNRQRTVGLRLERIVCAAMVQIVTQARHQQAQNLQIRDEPLHFARLHHGKHRLRDVQRVPPVVIFERPIVLSDAENPAAEDLGKRQWRMLVKICAICAIRIMALTSYGMWNCCTRLHCRNMRTVARHVSSSDSSKSAPHRN